MVVILIVQAPGSGECSSECPSMESSGISVGKGEPSSGSNSTSNRTVSFISSSSSFQVDPENMLATTKEEEWITKKKVDITTKKQIETRVKRQIVLEDGKVVQDSGPIVTTNTTEDTEQQEHEATEHRQVGNDDAEDGWVAVPQATTVVKEVKENKTKTREEKEEILETEDVRHCGDITDEAYEKAIQSRKKDVRLALREASDSTDLRPIGIPSERVTRYTTKSRKITDVEDVKHKREIKEDGRLVTETLKTTEHEELNSAEDPDDEKDDEEEYETHVKSHQKFSKTKDQKLVEYLDKNGVKVGEEIKFEAENVVGDRNGNLDDFKIDPVEWESLSERIRRMRREKLQKLEDERTDALTKKPLNFEKEEQTRKVETSKWLEHHFGSESRSSRSSQDENEVVEKVAPNKQQKASTSFINVTMKSSPNQANFKGISEWSSKKDCDKREIEMYQTNESNQQRGENRHHFHPAKVVETIATPKVVSNPKIPQQTVHKNGYASESGYKSENASSRNGYKSETDSPANASSSSRYYKSRSERKITPVVTSTPGKENSERIRRVETSTSQSELDASPLYATIQRRINSDYEDNGHQFDQSVERPIVFNGKSKLDNYNLRKDGIMKTETRRRPELKPTLVKRSESSLNKSWHSERRLIGGDDGVEEEPEPDYSPTPRRRAPSVHDVAIEVENGYNGGGNGHANGNGNGRKKLYQKTRFAEIPMVDHHRKAKPPQRKSSIGEKFRKIVGKFRGGGSGDRRKKKNDQVTAKSNGYTYESYGNGEVDEDVIDGGGARGLAHDHHYQQQQQQQQPQRRTPPSKSHPGTLSNIGTQTLDRDYRRKKLREQSSSSSEMRRNSPVHKYYLGEDPFGRSIYGKEKEYSESSAYRRKFKNGNSTDEEKRSVKSNLMNGVNSMFGGRLSKSTSRLTSAENAHRSSSKVTSESSALRSAQTLPRKKQVYINDPMSDQENFHSRRYGNESQGSLINVSMMSNGNGRSQQDYMDGPSKPARSYKTSLLRSKSFNVQLPGNWHEPGYKSNPSLHKIDETPAPLKSPGIVTSINRSTKDLSKSVDEDFDDRDSYRNYNFSKSNGVGGGVESKRNLFMKGLQERSPELFKTIHEHDVESDSSSKKYVYAPLKNRHKVAEYTNSFQSDGSSASTPRKPTVSFKSDNESRVIPTYIRNGNGHGSAAAGRRRGSDDYSETVRMTSKSTDPVRPSVTNTVQSFSKKTIPAKDGRTETIESSETRRVTKSQYRPGGGVNGENGKNRYKNVVELRANGNGRKK